MSRNITTPSTTTAFSAQSGIAFAVALAAVMLGIVHRLDQARVDKILAEHDAFATV